MFHKLNKDCVLIYSETSRDRSTSLPGYRDVTGWKSTGAALRMEEQGPGQACPGRWERSSEEAREDERTEG